MCSLNEKKLPEIKQLAVKCQQEPSGDQRVKQNWIDTLENYYASGENPALLAMLVLVLLLSAIFVCFGLLKLGVQLIDWLIVNGIKQVIQAKAKISLAQNMSLNQPIGTFSTTKSATA